MLSDGNIDEFFADLSDDPVEALFELNVNMSTYIENDYDVSENDFGKICIILESYIKKHQIFGIVERSSDETWGQQYSYLSIKIKALEEERELEQFKIDISDQIDNLTSNKGSGSFGYAYLAGNEKREIHTHIAEIRSLIEQSGLVNRKHNVLIRKLNAFAAEVDRKGTRTDALFTFMGDLAFVFSDMAKNGKPAIDEAKDILRIVSENRAKSEGVELPKPDEVPFLPRTGDS
jgi:hypothetical protein